MAAGILARSLNEVLLRWGRRNGAGDDIAAFGASVARSVEGVLARAGVDNPDQAVREAFGLAEGDQAAIELADLIEESLPAELRALDRKAELDDEPPAAPPPLPPETIDGARVRMAGDAWSELSPAYDQFMALETTAYDRWTMEDVLMQLAFMYATSTGKFADAPDRAERYAHRVRFEQAIDREMATDLPLRYATAVGIEDTFANWRGADPNTGREVHVVLQERYQHHRRANDIVQEAYVYGPDRRRVTLKQAAEREGLNPGGDRVYIVLELGRLARNPPSEDIKAKLRWDNIDLNLAEIWEIKPIRSLSQGVLQETFYRNKINFTVLPWRDEGERVSTEFLGPGRRDFPIYDLAPGDTLIVTTRGRVALPFTVAALPGIVGYIVVAEDENFQRARRRIRQFLRRLKQALQAVAEAILLAIVILIVIVILVVIVLVILIRLGIILPAPPPGPGGPPPALPPPDTGIVVPPIRKPVPVPGGMVGLSVLRDSRGDGLTCELTGVAGDVMTSLDFGAIRLRNLPPSAAGDVLGRLSLALQDFLQTFPERPRIA
jgi:hypothetical protein